MNPQECPGPCNSSSQRSPSPSPPQRTRNTSRVSSVTVTRTPMVEDDPTLNAIMSNVFGPMHYQQFSPQRFGTGRLGQAGPSSQSPGGAYGASFNANWSTGSEYRKFEQSLRNNQPAESAMPNATAPGGSYALQSEDLDEEEADENVSDKKQESLIEWFDRSVENELKKRRDEGPEASCLVKEALKTPEDKYGLHVSQLYLEKLSEATATAKVEVPVQLKMEPDTELTEAVDKLAKAEAMCAFAAAVQAAEQAAEAAPPELAEEAAAMGAARGFQVETREVRQVLPGERPIEVVAYLGITKPKDPKRS